MKNARVKNIMDYNAKMSQPGETVTVTDENDNEQKHDNGKMPYIVIIDAEIADLMMRGGKELGNSSVRVAQKGGGAGIS